LGGLPLYLELGIASGLVASIERHMRVCEGRKQGWSDRQVVMSLVLLNIAGGECVDDLRILEGDEGFARLLRRVELHVMRRKERREQERRWRKERRRAVPSPSAVFRYLSAFVDPTEEAKRGRGRAVIPGPNEHLRCVGRVNQDLIRFAQRKVAKKVATLDQDATLVETYKADALTSYQGYKSYQPLTTYWAEQDMIIHSEFRDGNVPAGFENLRALREALDTLPEDVEKVYYRSDSAAYQQKLLQYCAEAKDDRFGVIEFAVGADMTREFAQAISEVAEGDWHPLERVVEGEPLRQPELPGMERQLPFPTLEMGEGRYKVFGLVTNRHLAGDEIIRWYRGRCGKGEEVHGAMKNDLAAGRLPSGYFGANAAWWGISVLAYNLNSLLKRLLMPEGWASKRLKAVRFGLIHLAGRVVTHARQLIIRISRGHPAYGLLFEARLRLMALTAENATLAASGKPP